MLSNFAVDAVCQSFEVFHRKLKSFPNRPAVDAVKHTVHARQSHGRGPSDTQYSLVKHTVEAVKHIVGARRHTLKVLKTQIKRPFRHTVEARQTQSMEAPRTTGLPNSRFDGLFQAFSLLGRSAKDGARKTKTALREEAVLKRFWAYRRSQG